MRVRRAHLPLLSLSVVSLAAGPAAAQVPAEPTVAERGTDDIYGHSADRRTLDGHTFIPASDVRLPFTITSFLSDLVIGLGTTSGTAHVGDQKFSGKLDYAGIGGVLGYELAFLDHFSARVLIDETMFSGINGKSALAVGTQVQFGFGAGVTASTRIGDSLQLGLLFDFSERPNMGITIGKGLSSIANSCQEVSGCNVDLGQLFTLQ